MTRLGIRSEEVESAAEKILADGQSPTIEKIRLALGTGSNSTIAKYLHEWRSKRLMTSAQESSRANNPPDPVHAAVNRVWEQIREETNTEIKAFREKAEAEIQLAKKERDNAIRARDQSIQDYEELQKQYHQVTADKELLILDSKSQKQEYRLLEERYQGLDNQYLLLQQQTNERIQALEAQHKKETDHFQNEVRTNQAIYEKSLNEWVILHENERQRNIAEIDSFKVEQQKNKKIMGQIELVNKKLNIELVEWRNNLDGITKERDAALASSNAKNKIIADQEKIQSTIELILSQMLELKNAVSDKLNDIYVNISDQSNITNHLENILKTQMDLLLKNKPILETK